MKMIILIISIFLMFLLVPLVSATLQNETLYCFQGFNSDGTWIDWVNGTNATPKGNAGNSSDGCPLGFPSCATFDGVDDYFNISVNVNSGGVANLTQGGIIVVLMGNDTDDFGSIFTVSKPQSGVNALQTFSYDTSINYNRLYWDVQDETSLQRTSYYTPANSIQLQKEYAVFFQSYKYNYTIFINGSNQSLTADSVDPLAGLFYGNSTTVPHYDTAISGVSIDFNYRIRYDFKGKISMLAILNTTITAEKYNSTFTPNVQNCTQLLGLNIVADTTAPIVNTSFNVSIFNINDVINFSGNITDDIGIQSANITYNISGFLTKINFSSPPKNIYNVTKLEGVGGAVINFTMYATDTSNNVRQNSTLITITDNIAPLLNASLNDTSLNQNDGVNFSANISDETGLSFCQFITNQSGIQFFNKSITGTNDKCSQNFTVALSQNGVINFTLIINDTSNNKARAEFIVTVGDAVLPSISYSNFSSVSITDGSRVNITINASDNSLLSQINITVKSPTGILFNRSCTGLTTPNYICNITFFDGDETSEVGIWNLTTASAMDSNLNLITIYPNTTMTVNSAPSGGGTSSGGGGGGASIIQTVINQTNVTIVENCNFNNICEGNIGEDALGCPSDCKFNINYIFCDDPTQPCITDTIKRLFTSRSRVFNFSIILLLVTAGIIFTPNNSEIGKFIKKPLKKFFKKPFGGR